MGIGFTIEGSYEPPVMTPGACPDGACDFDFEVHVTWTFDFTPPPPPSSFQICFIYPSPLCITLPLVDASPLFPPPYIYKFDFVGDVEVECGDLAEIVIQWNAGLGFLPVAGVRFGCQLNC